MTRSQWRSQYACHATAPAPEKLLHGIVIKALDRFPQSLSQVRTASAWKISSNQRLEFEIAVCDSFPVITPHTEHLRQSKRFDWCKLHLVYMPKHGDLLNMSEPELSVLTQ